MASNRDVFRPWEIPVDISAAQPAQSAAVPAAVPCANGVLNSSWMVRVYVCVHVFVLCVCVCARANCSDATVATGSTRQSSVHIRFLQLLIPLFAGNADGDKCSQALHPYLPKFLSCVKAHGRDSTSSKLDLAKQNDLLFEAIFDATGTLLYHEACVLRIFGISKGRLRRIQERRMGLRDNHHGLVGV